MIRLQYKGRIHKAKFTLRSLRYIITDQAARRFPGLQRRWLFPTEGLPIADAASEDLPLPSALVEAPLPVTLQKLGISHPQPLQLTDHIYTLIGGTFVTGWAGAMIKDGLLLTTRPQHNWVSAVRARPYRIRGLPAERPYFNLMAPIPARGHIFHWLFNSILPLAAFLNSGKADAGLGLIVNRERSQFQQITIAFLQARYGIAAIEPVAEDEAVLVPNLQADVPVPHIPRALQSPLALQALDELADFITGSEGGGPKRIYISRNDARLRRVLNEDRILPILEAYQFRRVLLSSLPAARQVALFKNAEAVLAPHGAGLAHIAWCKPGARIIEFFPDPEGPRGRVKNASSDFWLISRLRGLSHFCHFGGPVESRDDGFRIAEELLAQSLKEAGIA